MRTEITAFTSHVLRLTLLLLLYLSLTGTAICQQPSWVRTKRDVRFPDQLYITGVGVASVGANKSESIRKSGDEAFSDIAKQLRANITDVSATKTIEIASGYGSTNISSEVKADLRVSTDLTLGGLKVVDSYYDRGDQVMYSLAVLDRQLVGSELKDKLKAYYNDYEGYAARVSGRDTRVVRLISVLSGAYKSSSEYNSLLPVYNYVIAPLVIDDSTWSMPGIITTTFIDQTARSLFRGLSLVKVSGESQEVKLNQVLQPLVVKATYTDSAAITRPVSGLRVAFKFVNGEGKISAASTTDEDGKAECQVYSLTPYASTFYTIRAQVDFSPFNAGIWNEADSWNSLLEANPVGTGFSLVKTRLTLDDKLRQLIISLTDSLENKGGTVCVSRIDFQGKIPGEMSEYLRQHIQSSIRQNSGLRLMTPPAADGNTQTPRGLTAVAGGEPPQLAAAAAAGIRFVISGSYWQRSDGTELDLNATDSRSGAIAASSGITIPGEILPDASLAPSNYDPAKDDAIIGNRNSGDDIKLNLWVNHPDGVYHDGDTLSVFLSADRDLYVELVYVDASGKCLIIFPNTYEWNNRISAGQVYTIPDEQRDGILMVEPPFGREIIKVYASEKPFPIPSGTKYRGLVLLNSLQDLQARARGIGLVSRAYRENSVVISTFQLKK